MALEGDKEKNMKHLVMPIQLRTETADIPSCCAIEDKESNAETNNMTCCSQALCCYISSKCSNNLLLSETNLP